MEGPEGALVEYVGDHPAERFDHVHLWQEDPIAALAWYQKHLNAPVRPGFTAPEQPVKRGTERSWPALNQEGMFRDPRAGVTFGDVVLTWYANQSDTPLVPSRGQLQDTSPSASPTSTRGSSNFAMRSSHSSNNNTNLATPARS